MISGDLSRRAKRKRRVLHDQSFLPNISPHEKVVLARDPRPSSPALADVARKAFVEAGMEVMDLGIAPDPLWYFSIFHYNLDGGLMISGSHNPSQHNGLTYHARPARRDPANGGEITAEVPSEELMGEALQDLRRWRKNWMRGR